MSSLRFEQVRRPELDSVSFEVSAGQFWALLGPNGAGKSTLLKVALGILPCSSGRVLLDGVDVRTASRNQLARQVAWVPQSAAEGTGFTALELVLMGRTPHQGALGFSSPADVAHAQRLLEEVGLGSLSSRSVDEMSGGERRLCYLARARMQGAGVLLFDEPTAFLDVRHQVNCLRTLHTMVEGGVAALAVLHDVNLAVRWATHAALLRKGRVTAAGPKAEVLAPTTLSELYGVALHQTEGGLFSAQP